MNTDNDRQSAKIYQFPARGRFAAHSLEGKRVANSDVRVSYGSWYHDEAIREELAPKKN
jgi:uncharacterized protein DUF2735